MPGIKEGRGDWEYQTMTLTAASNLSQGTGVALAAARTVSEYSGGQAGLLGFLKHPSANSLPAGQVIVAIPKPGCTAFVDVPTGLAASALSLGQTYYLYKAGGVTSYVTNSLTSGGVVTIVGPINSTNSTIEVSFALNAGQYYSSGSVSIQ